MQTLERSLLEDALEEAGMSGNGQLFGPDHSLRVWITRPGDEPCSEHDRGRLMTWIVEHAEIISLATVGPLQPVQYF